MPLIGVKKKTLWRYLYGFLISNKVMLLFNPNFVIFSIFLVYNKMIILLHIFIIIFFISCFQYCFRSLLFSTFSLSSLYSVNGIKYNLNKFDKYVTCSCHSIFFLDNLSNTRFSFFMLEINFIVSCRIFVTLSTFFYSRA